MAKPQLEFATVELEIGSEVHTGANANIEDVKNTVLETFDEFKRSNKETGSDEDHAQIEADIASQLKKNMDKKHTQGESHKWTVVLGRSFALHAELPENTVRFSFHTKTYNIFMFRIRV